MNIENINAMIDWVKTRKWKTRDWSDASQCFAGMVIEAIDGSEGGDARMIANTLGVDMTKVMSIYLLWDSIGPNDDGDKRSWGVFEGMSLEGQNAAVVDMLETLRDTGNVVWSKVPVQ